MGAGISQSCIALSAIDAGRPLDVAFWAVLFGVGTDEIVRGTQTGSVTGRCQLDNTSNVGSVGSPPASEQGGPPDTGAFDNRQSSTLGTASVRLDSRRGDGSQRERRLLGLDRGRSRLTRCHEY